MMMIVMMMNQQLEQFLPLDHHQIQHQIQIQIQIQQHQPRIRIRIRRII